MTLDLWENYKITKPIRLIELFAGYGSQALALKNIGVDFEHHQVVEFDKYAIKTYNALHDTNFETQDITQLESLDVTDTDQYDYIMTYSFPCTDLSLAGKQAGMGKGTRSGLLWEVERLLAKSQELPQVLLMENVTQVHGSKFKEDFDKWISFLTQLGYSNIWEDLNAKDYGIPQNRNRTFMVSILGDYDYQFQKPQELKLRLKDMLEDNVDEKYYISEKAINGMLATEYESAKPKQRIQNKKGISSTLRARDYKDAKLVMDEKLYNKIINKEISDTIRVGGHDSPTAKHNFDWVAIKEDTKKGKNPKCVVVGNLELSSHEQTNRVYSSKGLSPTLNTMQGGNRQPKILMPEDTKKGFAEAYEGDGVYTNRPHQKRGVVQSGMIQTIKTSSNDIGVVTKELKIRKLTPRECFRLMGLKDYQIDQAYLSGNSNAQLYKQVGNSIVVQVLERIFENLF